MKVTTNLPCTNNAPLNNKNKRPFKNFYTGFAPDARRMLLSAFKLSESTTDVELMDKFDDLLDKGELADEAIAETEKLKLELAGLMVDEAIRIGVLEKDDKALYTRLAVSDFDTTKRVIYSRHQNRIELDELMKLFGYQLYMSDKLERLKELNEDCFKLKLKELEAYDYRNPNHSNVNSTKTAIDNNSEPENELEALMKLSADELYYLDGKMERLKELNFSHFKLMYKEVFNAEYA